MPIKQSAMKALRQTKKRTLRNLEVKKKIAGVEKKLRKALAGKDKTALAALNKEWQKVTDKAAKVRVIAKNKANRLKSGWAKKISSLK